MRHFSFRPSLAHLAALADNGTLTSLTATTHPEISKAAVPADRLRS